MGISETCPVCCHNSTEKQKSDGGLEMLLYHLSVLETLKSTITRLMPWYLMCENFQISQPFQGDCELLFQWINHLSRCNHSVECLLQCSSSVQHLCRMLHLLNSACCWADSTFHYFCLATDWLMNNAGVILLAVSLHLFSRMWRHVGRQASVYGKADKQTDTQTDSRQADCRQEGR